MKNIERDDLIRKWLFFGGLMLFVVSAFLKNTPIAICALALVMTSWVQDLWE